VAVLRVIGAALAMAFWAMPAVPQAVGVMTIETGGESHRFAATGVWETVHGSPDGALGIGLMAEHPDGTHVILDFLLVGGQTQDVLFRFREPDTAEFYGREWTEAPGFRVTVSEARREGDIVMLSGSFRGPILDPNPPGGSARIRGRFEVELAEPVYSPN
jgi:hypothetical protein